MAKQLRSLAASKLISWTMRAFSFQKPVLTNRDWNWYLAEAFCRRRGLCDLYFEYHT